MKSKLLKLKEMTAMDWVFVSMYAVGMVSIVHAVCARDWPDCLVSILYMLAVYGWSVTYKRMRNVTVSYDAVSESNDKLIVINKELTDRYNEELSLAQGLISENKELKMKLKNAKMENSRIRKGGKTHE